MQINILLLILTTSSCRAAFTLDFSRFVVENYGKTVADSLERLDQGVTLGSFGGRSTPDEPIRHTPIIFVHGTTMRAGFFQTHQRFFMKKGFSSGELYATTYGDGGVQGFTIKHMECSDVKIIRNMIRAVSDYTGHRKVNIVAFSMGCAISRKAILGGRCVDTHEDLGVPLTAHVDTFIAAGGVAYGLMNCVPSWPACNPVTGMICSSAFLKDVNAQPVRYEGSNSFAIYSLQDGVIGTTCCGHTCAELKNANSSMVRLNFGHGMLILNTLDEQYHILGYDKHNSRRLRRF